MPASPCPWCKGPLKVHCDSRMCGWARCPQCNVILDFRRRANLSGLEWPDDLTPEDN